MWYESAVRRSPWLIVLAAVAAAVAAIACSSGGSDDAACNGGAEELGGQTFAARSVRITSSAGRSTTGCVLVADSRGKRSQGLTGVTDLEGRLGMVFVYDADSRDRYWMKDTPMPLSIAWFDAAGAFVSSADMDPCLTGDCPNYGAAAPYRYALEVPQGRLPALGIGAGARLQLDG